MIVPSIGALFYFVIFTDCWFTPIIYVTTKVFIIAWPSVCAYSVLGKRIGRVISRPTRHTQAIGTGILLGASIAALMFGLMQTTLGQVVIASSESIESKAHTLKIMRHYWLFALFLSVAHSLIEEYYWRRTGICDTPHRDNNAAFWAFLGYCARRIRGDRRNCLELDVSKTENSDRSLDKSLDYRSWHYGNRAQNSIRRLYLIVAVIRGNTL
jgi:hypothetical protein